MYIPTWLIVIIVVVGGYLYVRKKNSGPQKNRFMTVETMWDRAEKNMAEVMEKSPLLEDYLQDERDMVRAMERDMIRLRERYKHDPQKQLEISQDWADYSGAVSRVKFSREMLDVDTENTAFNDHHERTKDAYAVIHEVAKRVWDMLGEDSSSRVVHERLAKEADAVHSTIMGK